MFIAVEYKIETMECNFLYVGPFDSRESCDNWIKDNPSEEKGFEFVVQILSRPGVSR